MNTVTGINRLAVGLARSPVHSYTPTARTTVSGFDTLCVCAPAHTPLAANASRSFRIIVKD